MEKRDERLKKIIQTLKINTASTIQELADELSVSHMTVRRDLEVLTRQNIVKLLYGGVVLKQSQTITQDETKYSLLDAGSVNPQEKMRIGKAAASLLEPNDIIIIDSGSTTEYLAKYIPDDFPLTIICYALNILLECVQKNSCRLLFAGGNYHDNTLMFEGEEGIQLIGHTRATKAFLSASGISGPLGVTCSNSYERLTKRAVINSSQKKILLADSSKFGTVQTEYFADLDEFDIMITDTEISDEYRDILHEKNLELKEV